MKPKVVTICGSTRFADQHAVARWEMERTGKFICLMINYLPESYGESIGLKHRDHFGEQLGLKELLDELHFRKIDLSDEVYVVNVDGYVGESTQREIAYGIYRKLPIRWLEPEAGERVLVERSDAIKEQIAKFNAAPPPTSRASAKGLPKQLGDAKLQALWHLVSVMGDRYRSDEIRIKAARAILAGGELPEIDGAGEKFLRGGQGNLGQELRRICEEANIAVEKARGQ